MFLYTIILSGGMGTRLWPMSREKHPKQLLKLWGRHSLFQNTVLRMNGFAHPSIEVQPVLTVSNEAYRFIVAEQLREIQSVHSGIILEPMGKNTAPSITLAAELIGAKNDADALMLVMPADHLIDDAEAFQKAVSQGITAAINGEVVCFGLKPERPHTGYGYIQTITSDVVQSGQIPSSFSLQIECFIEKPDEARAKALLQSSNCWWNSGIFLMKVSTWRRAMNFLQPEIYRVCQQAIAQAQSTEDFVRIPENVFAACPNDSIDFAVMEKIGNRQFDGLTASMVPLVADWIDVGAWDSVWSRDAQDADGNVQRGCGASVLLDTRDSLVQAGKNRLVAVLGLDNVVVVDTADAVLVADKRDLSQMKELITVMKAQFPSFADSGRQVFRPWGSFDLIDQAEHFKVKRVVVEPGHILSLQKHHHRAEHWVVVKGIGRVTRDDEVFELRANESTYIPCGVAHRLENPYSEPLELIEVQTGDFLDESDIIRLEDIYGRILGDTGKTP